MTQGEQATEFNCDALVGPTHNYGGLARGNFASAENRRLVSHPREAALQGLAKMKFLSDLGVPQLVLPPHPRPAISALRRLGFGGSDAQALARAAKEAPELLAACMSASGMWAANAATISPSADTTDGRLHITPANLSSHFHRSLETSFTSEVLRRILPGPLFVHHEALPGAPELADEGAANHSRMCAETNSAAGVEMFTFARAGAQRAPSGAPVEGRQTRAASEAIARLHGLAPERTLFAQQHPDAIAAGAFHNDVVAVAHQRILFFHARAFADSAGVMAALATAFENATGANFLPVEVAERTLSLADAVACYVFNSQLVTVADGATALIAPAECEAHAGARAAIDLLCETAAVRDLHFVDVRQSMRNGGGPACLRLRIMLTTAEQAALHAGVRLNDALHAALHAWIKKHYREQLAPADLADPHLMRESQAALAELADILGLPGLYSRGCR